jgi:2-oxoglutarate ferredoxin oxidoreductase subunit gamma
VVIADGDVGSPVVGNPSVTVLLNQASLDRYGEKTKPGGVCIINSSLIDVTRFDRQDVETILLPMNEIALDLGDTRMVNMVAVGAYVAKTEAVAISSLNAALREALPERNHRFIPANMKAIEAGAARVCAKKS